MKKRVLSVLLTIVLLITMMAVAFSSFQVAAENSKILIGDVDLSNKIDVSDATTLQKAIAKILNIDDIQKIAADTMKIGSYSVQDATIIQKYVAKLETGSHCGEYVDVGPTETEKPTTEPTEAPTEPLPTEVPLADTVNDGTILQAWNWSFNNVTANLQAVKDAGFTTIQVSPPNEIKEATNTATILQSNNKNGWWMFYQPAGFQLNESTDNALGTKSEFVNMCSKAHELGLKIIVDCVINHMGTCDNEESVTSTDPMKHVTPKAKQFEPEIYNNKLFHNPWEVMQYWEDGSKYNQERSTYDLTRRCTSRLPDLKTEDATVQGVIYDYMDEIIASGADGFRFDAAKHIETESDIAQYRSNFWINTLEKVRTKYKGKVECYAYGEILNNCGVNRPFSMYTKHFDVTDSGSNWKISDAVRGYGGNATPGYPNSNFTKENCVLWDESHDTYTDGSTTSYTTDVRNKIWALVAGRADITCVYLARPDDATNLNSLYSSKLGVAKKTSWSNNVTAAINKFHNAHIGDGEYCTSNQNGRAYIERGDDGVIIVGLGNTKGGSVSLTNHKLKAGSYTDMISGNTFTVTSGSIKGSVGSSGVACLFYGGSTPGPEPTHETGPSPEKPYPYKEGCITVALSNNYGWANPSCHYWPVEETTWPGIPFRNAGFTNEYGEQIYYVFVPEGSEGIVISNVVNGEAVDQTVNYTNLSGDIALYISGGDEKARTIGDYDINSLPWQEHGY